MGVHTYTGGGLLRSTDSKTANTRLGATKPQTKANTMAARVSRAYVVRIVGSRLGGGLEQRRKRGTVQSREQTLSNWMRVIIRRRTFSTFSLETSTNTVLSSRANALLPVAVGSGVFWVKNRVRPVDRSGFTFNLHSRGSSGSRPRNWPIKRISSGLGRYRSSSGPGDVSFVCGLGLISGVLWNSE